MSERARRVRATQRSSSAGASERACSLGSPRLAAHLQSAKNRSALYQGLSGVIDEPEAIEEMLANFATRDDEEWITKQFLRAELAGVNSELKADVASLRVELHTEISRLRSEVHAETQRLIMWMVGTNIALFGVLFTLIRLTG